MNKINTKKYKILSHKFTRSGNYVAFNGIIVRLGDGNIYRLNEPIVTKHDPTKRVIDYIKPVIEDKLIWTEWE